MCCFLWIQRCHTPRFPVRSETIPCLMSCYVWLDPSLWPTQYNWELLIIECSGVFSLWLRCGDVFLALSPHSSNEGKPVIFCGYHLLGTEHNKIILTASYVSHWNEHGQTFHIWWVDSEKIVYHYTHTQRMKIGILLNMRTDLDTELETYKQTITNQN